MRPEWEMGSINVTGFRDRGRVRGSGVHDHIGGVGLIGQ